jgi:hypothetical protein
MDRIQAGMHHYVFALDKYLSEETNHQSIKTTSPAIRGPILIPKALAVTKNAHARVIL